MEILRLLLSLRNVQVNLKDTIPDEREKKVLKFWRHLLALSRLRLIEAKGFEFENVMGGTPGPWLVRFFRFGKQFFLECLSQYNIIQFGTETRN